MIRRFSDRVVRRVFWSVLLTGCVPRPDLPDIDSPEPPSDLRVTASASNANVFEGAAVVLTAVPTGGTAPYLFRWDQNAGPVELELVDVRESELATNSLTTPGRYVFRVIVTDAKDFHATDHVAVLVSASFTAEAPALAVVGEPVELSVELGAQTQDATLLWEVTEGTGTLDDPASVKPRLTVSEAETVKVRLTVGLPGTGEVPLMNTREFEIAGVTDLSPQVLFETNFGNFMIELDAGAAPLHAANFLLYVDDDFYNGLLFHRIACTRNPLTGECPRFVVQGGGFERVGEDLREREPTREPVPSEAGNGLTNGKIYSVALALSGGNPDSGTTQFFLNLNEENGFLDDQGFTVFGQVVGDTVAIELFVQVPTEESPILDGEVSLPTFDITMIRVSRVEE